MIFSRWTWAFCAVAASLSVCHAQTDGPSEIEKLKAQLAEQMRQIDTLRAAVAEQQKRIDVLASAQPAAPSRPLMASTTPMVVPTTPAPRPTAVPQKDTTAVTASPLQLRIGETSIIPIGFLDVTAVFRDKDAGSGIGSNFGSIPYNNAASSKLSEFRFSPQNSRLGFRMDTNVHGAHVIAYNEFDFLGTSGAFNIGVTNGAFVPRLRLFWVDIRKNKFEFLAGQSWSLMTPNRKQLSPLPADIFYSQSIDVNYIIGMPWTRQPGFRFVAHPNEKITAGVALENPDQYIGGSGGGPTITLPAAFAGLGGSEFDNATNVLSTPNLHPDIIGKVALDPNARVHVEAVGIERTFKDWNPLTNQHFTTVGAGGSLNANFEVVKGIRLLTNNHWGNGTGRYIFGNAPDLVVRADGSISPIHLQAYVQGVEATRKNSLLYFYFGGLYIGQNAAVDANGTSLVGYGYRGSPSSHNRSVEEFTFGFNQTIWKDAKWGAINYMMQYVYLSRNPWFVATGQPSGAHDNTVFLNLRYTLPGAPPAVR
jgi:hypothetical protein